MGESFIRTGEFLFEGKVANLYQPLYPILISITTFFKTETAFILVKLLNSFLSTSIIFPMYLLSREFMNKKESFLISLLSVFIPESFVYSYSIMSENLFYPLFLFSIYFFYKSMKRRDKKFQILSGVFVGLSILTRTLGFVLPTGMMLTLFIHSMIDRRKIFDILKCYRRYWIFFSVILMIILPWFLTKNIYSFDLSIQGITGNPKISKEVIKNITTLNFLYYMVVNTSFLIICSGILFFIFSIYMTFKIKGIKDFKILSWSIFLVLILLCTFWSFTSRAIGSEKKVMGRYMAPLIFPILIMGGIGAKAYEKKKNDKILLGIVAVCSLVLISIPIDIRTGGFDTLSTIFLLIPKQAKALGIISFTVLDLLIKISFTIVPFVLFLFRKYFTLDNIVKFTIAFLVLNTLTATLAMRYASLDAEEFMEFALWMRDNLTEGKVLFDVREDGEEIELFWIIEAVKFYTDFPTIEGDYNYNDDCMYVISKRELPLTLLRELDTLEGFYEKRELKLFLYENS